MPNINAANLPFISAGNLLNRLILDSTLAVRWLQPLEPCYYEVLNRPISDTVLRQLILAKAIDSLSNSVGYLLQFPFVIQPIVVHDASTANVPVRLFWDFHVSIPDSWSNIRLARIDRLSGVNETGGTGDSGTLRFIFTGNARTDGSDSSTETALFYLDYTINSTLAYQTVRPQPADSASGITGMVLLPTNQANTIGGTVVFATQDTTVADMTGFLDLVAPGSGAFYEIADSSGTGSDLFSLSALSHGTGLLTSSAYNGIVALDSTPLNWVEAFNYPFGQNATLTSQDGGVTIPVGLFYEFNLIAPSNDQPSGVSSDGTHYPVWISSITESGGTFTFNFSTYNTTDSAPDPTTPIVFATLALQRSMVGNQIVAIEPYHNLELLDNANPLNTQHMGRGHVVLSSNWDATGGSVDAFFASLPESPSDVTTVTFTPSTTRISSFGLSRIPKYVPTKGQSQALAGSSARFGTPLYPSDTNRYVTEQDSGLGDAINLDGLSGITSDASVSTIGYAATRVHRLVNLVVDQSTIGSDPTYYDNILLPRLIILLGSEPVFGDVWYNGTRFLTYNSNAWIG